MTIPTIRKQWEFRPQHIQPTKVSLCWKAAVVFCRTRRVVGSSDASPLFGDPIWHFGNVRRGNRISGSHSRQQEITTSRREMTWNDSKPLGPSGQTSKSCLLQSFEFIVEEHQNKKTRHNFFEAQNVFYYMENYFKNNMYSYTFSEGWPPWPPVLGEVSWDSSSPSFNRCQAAWISRQLNGRMEKPKPRYSRIFIHPKGWKNPHVQRPKSLNLPGRVSSNLYQVLGDRVLKILRSEWLIQVAREGKTWFQKIEKIYQHGKFQLSASLNCLGAFSPATNFCRDFRLRRHCIGRHPNGVFDFFWKTAIHSYKVFAQPVLYGLIFKPS